MVAAVHRNSGLFDDYITRGLDIADGLKPNSIAHRISQLRKLFTWRMELVPYDGDYEAVRNMPFCKTLESACADLQVSKL